MGDFLYIPLQAFPDVPDAGPPEDFPGDVPDPSIGSAGAGTPTAWQPDRPFAEWIVENKHGREYRGDRKRFDQAMEHLDEIGRQVRIVPHLSEGKCIGFKLFAVRTSGIFAAAGLRSGDIVTRVNGVALDSPGKLDSKVLLPAGADRLEVELLRNGETLKLVYLLH